MNEWTPLCKKPCKRCPNQSFASLSDEAIFAHLIGKSSTFRDVIGIYPLDEESKTKFLVIDLDDADWKESTSALRRACANLGVIPAVERSRSGNGAHIWFFFTEPLDAALARKFGTVLITKAMQLGRVGFESYDRMFPAQDLLPKGGFGNLVALPFQGRARAAQNSLFVDEDFKPFPDQWRFLSALPLLTRESLERTVKQLGGNPLGSLAGASESTRSKNVLIPRKRVALTSMDFAKPVAVTRAAMLAVPKDGLSSRAADAVRRLAAFANQDFYRAQNMRQSVFGKPRILDYGEEDESFIKLPRGCYEPLLAMLKKAGADVEYIDERNPGRSIDVEFTGTLRPGQEVALETLAAHDDGILVAPTGFGKTVVAAALIAKRKVNTLVIVPSTPILEQWVEKLPAFLKINDEPQVLRTKTGRKRRHQPQAIGTIAQGKVLPGGIVDIALYQSLLEPSDIRGAKIVRELVGDYGLVVVDECHHAPADQLSQVLRNIPARYVYGLTATPRREDGKTPAVAMLCGPILHDADVVDQIKSQAFKRLLDTKFLTGKLDSTRGLASSSEKPMLNELINAICKDEERNSTIAADVCAAIATGHTPLVLTKRVDHARTLAEMIGQTGKRTVLLIGSASKDVRKAALDELAGIPEDEQFAIVATGSYVGEGFDEKRLDSLFLACPVSFDHVVKQYVGRLHRDCEGKTDVCVHDYVDIDYPMLANMYRKRLKAYAALGYIADEGRPEGTAIGAATVFHGSRLLDTIASDISNARSQVRVSSSAAIPAKRSGLVNALSAAAERSVNVGISLKEAGTASGRNRLARVKDLLTSLGCSVWRNAETIDSVVVDSQIVWIGSFTPLGRHDEDASALRLVSPSIAQALIRASEPPATV